MSFLQINFTVYVEVTPQFWNVLQVHITITVCISGWGGDRIMKLAGGIKIPEDRFAGRGST